MAGPHVPGHPPFLMSGGTVDPNPRRIQGGGSPGIARPPFSRRPLRPCRAASRGTGWGARAPPCSPRPRPPARLHARTRVVVSCVAPCRGQAEPRGTYEPDAESLWKLKGLCRGAALRTPCLCRGERARAGPSAPGARGRAGRSRASGSALLGLSQSTWFLTGAGFPGELFSLCAPPAAGGKSTRG